MAMSSIQGGKRVTTAFFLVCASAPAELPSTAKLRTGLAFDSDDCLYATQTEPTTKLYSYGIATRLDGAVWVSSSFTGAPKEVFHPTLGFVLVSQTGALFISGFAGMALPDAGSGAVDAGIFGLGAATFTRATAAACRLSTGLWKLDVASGVARSHYWEYTPGVMTYGGYLTELAATQLCLDPRDMTTANWTLGATLTRLKNRPGIDGAANTATRLTGGAVAGTNTILQTLVAAASSRTVSFFIKRITGTGAINLMQGATTLDVAALLNTTSYVQVQLNASVLNSAFGIQVATNGDVIDVDCGQFEAGAMASTPIPAAGSRNADLLTYTYAGNANAASGTCYAELAHMFANGGIIGIGFGTGATNHPLRSSADTDMRIGDGTNTATKAGLTAYVSGVRKRASSWGADGLAVTGDGATVATATFAGAMASTGIAIGSGTGGANQWNGTIKNVKIWTYQRNDLSSMTA